MTKWGTKPFIDWFTKHLTKYDLKPLISGVESLFKTINNELPQHIKKIDKSREILSTK